MRSHLGLALAASALLLAPHDYGVRSHATTAAAQSETPNTTHTAPPSPRAWTTVDGKQIPESVAASVVIGIVTLRKPDGSTFPIPLAELAAGDQCVAMQHVGKFKQPPNLDAQPDGDRKANQLPLTEDRRLEWRSFVTPSGSAALVAKKEKGPGHWAIQVFGESFKATESARTSERVVIGLPNAVSLSLGFYGLEVRLGNKNNVRVPGAWTAGDPQIRTWSPPNEAAVDGEVIPDTRDSPVDYARRLTHLDSIRVRTSASGPMDFALDSLPGPERVAAVSDLSMWNAARLMKKLNTTDIDMRFLWEAQLKASLPKDWKHAALVTRQRKEVGELAAKVDEFAAGIEKRKALLAGRVRPAVDQAEAFTQATRFCLTSDKYPANFCIESAALFANTVVEPILKGDNDKALVGFNALGKERLRLLDDLVRSTDWGRGLAGGRMTYGEALLLAYDFALTADRRNVEQRRAAIQQLTSVPEQQSFQVLKRPLGSVEHPDLEKAWSDYKTAAEKATEGIRAELGRQFDEAAAAGDLDKAEKWQGVLEAFNKKGSVPVEIQPQPGLSAAIAGHQRARELLSGTYESTVVALTKEKQLDLARTVREEGQSLFKVEKPKHAPLPPAPVPAPAVTPPLLEDGKYVQESTDGHKIMLEIRAGKIILHGYWDPKSAAPMWQTKPQSFPLTINGEHAVTPGLPFRQSEHTLRWNVRSGEGTRQWKTQGDGGTNKAKLRREDWARNK